MGGGNRRRQSCRKGSYFFVLDGFMASMIFVTTVVLVFALFIYPRPKAQSFTYGGDYLDFLTKTQLRDFQSDTVQTMKQNGIITDLHNTLAGQIVVFHNQSRDSDSWTLLNSTMGILPATVGVNVSLADPDGRHTLLYERNYPGTNNKTHLIVRSIEYAVPNPQTIYGPVVLQVEVWS